MKNLRLAPLALAIAVVGCGGNSSDSAGDAAPATPKAAAQVVHVYNWSDYIAEDTLENFQKETGIRVIYDVYDSNEVLEAKLMTGGSGYDLVFPSARPFAERHVTAGVYAPLDKSALSGLDKLDPEVMEGLAAIDPGNVHVLPYMWGTTGIGINVEKVRAALGEDAALDSWGLLFDPANAAKLAGCGIAVLDDEQETFAAALIWKGLDPNIASEENNAVVAEVYDGLRPHLRYFSSSKYLDDLANGDLCITMGYSGDIFQARDRAAEAENGVEIEYFIPKEGALRWVDVMAIPADARNRENAHAFINYLLRPEVIAAISDYVAYANPNLDARALIDEEVANDPSIYPTEDVLAKLIDPVTFAQDAQRTRVRTWTTIKSGR
ncbi:MAG: polyamine ABC transporter substrate-binding protein [Lysobacteraceae bacterium]